MREHVLVVTRPDGWDALDDDFEFDIECTGEGCDLWAECMRLHLSKYDYRDDDDIEHGQPHRQLEGGWCVPAPGCAYRDNGLYSDAIWDIARDHGPGRWLVDLDWLEWGEADLIFLGSAGGPDV